MFRIKEILKEKGKTQIELANELSVTPIGLNKIINGNPTVDTLDKIAKVLEVDIRTLFSQSDGEVIYALRDGNYVPIGELYK